MNTCTSCGKIKLGNSVMQGCACQNSMQAPPAAQPEQKPLTDEQIRQVMKSLGWTGEHHDDFAFARAIETKLRSKNEH